jgi:hypothetical protein
MRFEACTIIPAAVPMTAVIVGIAPVIVGIARSKRPDADDMYTERRPVIGWRIDDEYVVPILPGAVISSFEMLIELADKSLLSLDGDLYPTIEAAKQTLLRAAQKIWDDRDAARKKPAAVTP